MALAVRPDIDFSSRVAALRAVCEDLGLPANQVPDQSMANNQRVMLKFINNCRSALSLPLYTSMDYTKFTSAINEISAAAGTAKPENSALPYASSSATPPVQGSVLSVTNGIWINAAAATYTYQWQRNGVNYGGTASSYTLLAADVGHGYEFTCNVVATTGAGASTPATSNPVIVP